MNINYLILIIASLLGSIYVFFSPNTLEKKNTKQHIPLIELHNFTVYKFDTQSLVSTLDGKIGKKFPAKYELENFLFTEKQENEIASISAVHGLYVGDLATFTKNVHYFRSDGLTFKSQQVLYDTAKHYIKSPVHYVAYLNQNVAKGSYLYYDTEKKWIYSKYVNFEYNIPDEEKGTTK